MSDLLVILTRPLVAITNTDDLEFRVFEAVKLYYPTLEVRVSRHMTSNKLGLDLTMTGYAEPKIVQTVRDMAVKAVTDYFGKKVTGTTIRVVVKSTILEEMTV